MRAARRRAARRFSGSMSNTFPCRSTETGPPNPLSRDGGINNPSLVCRNLFMTIIFSVFAECHERPRQPVSQSIGHHDKLAPAARPQSTTLSRSAAGWEYPAPSCPTAQQPMKPFPTQKVAGRLSGAFEWSGTCLIAIDSMPDPINLQ